VAEGLEVRVAGAGHAGRVGGPPGDLYLSLHVEPHPVFERRGQDLVAILEIDLTQAALGTEAEFDGLDDRERVRIEPGTESGAVLRLKGKGIPNLNRRGRGDLYLSVHVRIPDARDKRQRELLAELAELRGAAAGKGAIVDATLTRPERA
jgi:DnaJ-class molecular chaperone